MDLMLNNDSSLRRLVVITKNVLGATFFFVSAIVIQDYVSKDLSELQPEMQKISLDQPLLSRSQAESD
jgi:hypothetical protein